MTVRGSIWGFSGLEIRDLQCIIFYVRRLALLLHLYQPPTQDAAMLKRVAEECYLPLLTFLRNKRNFKITLNIPLSLLELMDGAGYNQWILAVKELVDAGRVELTGSAAYHPILTLIPPDLVERQVILNEFGLGYYFGRLEGFEGESAVLISNLAGFFPPELAVNEGVIKSLEDLSYSWVIVDETSLPLIPGREEKYGVYTMKNSDIKVVCRNRSISNVLAFNQGSGIRDFTDLFQLTRGDFLVALDGEFFGHHNREGLYLLDLLGSFLAENNVMLVTASEYVGHCVDESLTYDLQEFRESSWAAGDGDVASGNIYAMWKKGDSKLHKQQWKLFDYMVKSAGSFLQANISLADFENKPMWKHDILDQIKDAHIKRSVEISVLFMKALHSDQFWWASAEKINNEIMYHPEMVRRALDLWMSVAKKSNEGKLLEKVLAAKQKIESLL